MISRVVMTRRAQQQLRRIIRYIHIKFKNIQAEKAVLADARKTRDRLVDVAESLKYCDDPELRELGYRTIHFRNHNYFFVYEVRGTTAYIEAVYHDLQDYEQLFKKEVL